MSVGSVNKGALALIGVLLLAVGGYLWWQMLYKPAVAERETAVASQQQAQAGLDAARQRLQQAQQRLADQKKKNAKPDDATGRLAIASSAIPEKMLLGNAVFSIEDFATRSGVTTNVSAQAAQSQSGSTDSPTITGATSMDLTFKAAGTSAQMRRFISLIESGADTKDGKLHSRGRLFNVVGFSTNDGSGDGSSAGAVTGSFTDSSGGSGDVPVKPGQFKFTVIVRIYMQSTADAASVGEQTPDAAAAGSTTGGTTTTTPAADGSATTTPAAGGGATTATTDPNAGTTGSSTTTPTSGSSAPSPSVPTPDGATTPAAGGN